jgi:hypothetical protein
MDVDPNPARLYQSIAATLDQFARDHGLFTERFRHGGATWDFIFRHPVGGSARLQVLPAHEAGFLLVATWTVHDLPARRRMWQRSDLKPAASDSAALRDALERLLREVLTWDGSSWTKIVPHYPAVSDEVIANAIARDALLPLPRNG